MRRPVRRLPLVSLVVTAAALFAAVIGAVADEPRCVLTGTTVDERGRPLEDVDIRVWIQGAEDSGDATAASARSDSEGCFALGGLSPGIYRVEAARDDRVTARRDQVLVGPQGAAGLVLLLEPGTVVTGRVLASDGQPFEGAVACVGPPRRPSRAEIESWSRVTRAEAGLCARSGAAGAFSVTGLPRDSRLVARAVRTGRHYTDLGAVELPASRSRIDRIELRLPPPIPVIGRIELPDGRPFSGPASLSGGPGFEVRDGKVATEVEQAGHACVFIDDFCVVCRELVPGEQGVADFGTIRLDPGVRIEGSVRDQAGRPIPAATITGDCGGSHRRTHSDEDGSFVLSGIDERRDEHGALRCGFSVEAAGFESRSVQFVPGFRPATVVMEATGAVEGRVVTGTPPQPVPGLSIRAFPEGGLPGAPLTLSTPNGWFRVSDLAPGRYSLRIGSPGFVSRWIHDLRLEPGARVSLGDVALVPGHELRGRVLDRRDGEGIGRAWIYVGPAPWPHGLDAEAEIRTDPDGGFALSGLAAGRHRLWVKPPDRPPFECEIDLPATGLVTLEIPRDAVVYGTARDRTGEPLADRVIRLSSADGSEKAATADRSGRFRFEGVAPGVWRLHLSTGAEDGRQVRFPVMVEPGERRRVDLSLEAATLVHATVERGWNFPVVATEWRRLDEPRPGSATSFAEVSPDGSLSVLLPARGIYEVEPLSQTEWRGDERGGAIVVDARSPTGQPLRIEAPTARISGTVFDANGVPVPRASVMAIQQVVGTGLERSHRDTRTDARGDFRLERLQHGTYALFVTASGFVPTWTGSIELARGATVVAPRIELDAARPVRLRVLDPLGAPVPEAEVPQPWLPRYRNDRDEMADDAGSITIAVGSAGREVVVAAQSFAPAVAFVPPAAEHAPAPQLVLERGVPVTIRVTGEGGAPVEGAVLEVRTASGTDLSRALSGSPTRSARQLVSDGDGVVELARLAPGSYRLLVRAREGIASSRLTVGSGPATATVRLGELDAE
ncbi:MAG: carboxypeptidase-like regulatory domain-containing protein [Acidobacteria bacterium]|jgi:protocatechuate 3,4-dioxygenase beta subunit|nr:carboxypeptidase-like regulatory domain-containing protein [Acidobacteriota bacterium]